MMLNVATTVTMIMVTLVITIIMATMAIMVIMVIMGIMVTTVIKEKCWQGKNDSNAIVTTGRLRGTLVIIVTNDQNSHDIDSNSGNICARSSNNSNHSKHVIY